MSFWVCVTGRVYIAIVASCHTSGIAYPPIASLPHTAQNLAFTATSWSDYMPNTFPTKPLACSVCRNLSQPLSEALASLSPDLTFQGYLSDQMVGGDLHLLIRFVVGAF
ncbi:hypothetical protein HDK90DRAFT_276642 [Phyllosticta capitalensis]|uniref:Uncharacterized protein n=1 Tax=Phyllosticta capitalensis TaxID=121624 RepID=A0ABR1YMU9_9PEZI